MLLTLAFWLHMAATVVWIGGLFFQAVILTPAMFSSLEPRQQAALHSKLRRRFEPLAWLSLIVLIGTGLLQMSASPSYEGLLVFDNRWSKAILVKHLVVGLMIVAAGFQTWSLGPRLNRLLLLMARGEDQNEERQELQSRYQRLAGVNLLLGLLTLIMTSIARTA